MAGGRATRDILWARAGGRCAICRRKLPPAPDTGGGGVRIEAGRGDRYDNLILLCRRRHDVAASGAMGEAAARLARIKDEHEQWVRASAPPERGRSPGTRYDPRFAGITLLPRIRAGGDLVRLFDGAHSMQYDYDPVAGAERRLLEELLHYLRGLLEVWGDYREPEKSRVVLHLDALLHRLEEAGLLLCAARHAAQASIAGTDGEWVSLRIWVLREG
jgi:hypothetical protein